MPPPRRRKLRRQRTESPPSYRTAVVVSREDAKLAWTRVRDTVAFVYPADAESLDRYFN